MVPHLGLQGCRITLPYPRRGSGEGRLAARCSSGRTAEAGEHAGRAGIVLTAEVAAGTFPAAPSAISGGRRIMLPLIAAVGGVIGTVYSLAKGASWLSDQLSSTKSSGAAGGKSGLTPLSAADTASFAATLAAHTA